MSDQSGLESPAQIALRRRRFVERHTATAGNQPIRGDGVIGDLQSFSRHCDRLQADIRIKAENPAGASARTKRI